jgi:hypothetical protein
MKNQKQNQDSNLSQEEKNYDQQSLLSEPQPTLSKKINTERNPSKCQQILHTITTNTAPEEKSHLPLSRDLWALKLSNYQNPVYL